MVSLRRAVKKAAQLLGKHSIPFWSPRYEAHMYVELLTTGVNVRCLLDTNPCEGVPT